MQAPVQATSVQTGTGILWPGTEFGKYEMKLIRKSALNPVTSKDVQSLVRQLRVVLTNARIYEAGHALRESAHRGIWDFLLELSGDVGPVLIEVVPWGVLINGKGLETEDKAARMVTSWLQERAVSNFFFDGRGRLEELSTQMDVVASLNSDQIDALRLGTGPAELGESPLAFNVTVDSSAAEEGEIVASQSQPGADSSGLESTEAAATEPQAGDAASGAEQEPGGWADSLSHLNPGDSEGGAPDVDAVEAEEAAPTPEELEVAEVAQLLEEGAEAVCAALSVHLLSDSAVARKRRSLILALQRDADSELRAQVLGRLTQELAGELEMELGVSLLQACEELVPVSIEDGSLHTVSAFCEQLDLLESSEPELAGRAEAARAYMSSPELIEKMVEKMQVLPRDQCELIRKILKGFGHSAMPQLFELMMIQERKSVRLSLAEVMNYQLREADSEVDLDELTAPLLRELSRDSNAWYVRRNVVYILNSVRTPQCQRALLRLADRDQDPRVLTEVARCLLHSELDAARDLLEKLAVDPRFSDAAGLFEVIRSLYPKDPERVLAGLEQRLSVKDVPAAVAEGCLLGLAWSASEAALPFLRRLLTEQRGGLLKRPGWSDAVRASAIEAIATIRGQEARAVLELGRQDKVSEVRRLAVEFMHMEPSRASVAAFRRIGVSPREDER